MSFRKKLAAALLASILGLTGVTVATAAEDNPTLVTTSVGDLIVAKAKGYPAGADITWKAEIDGGSGSSTGKTSAQGASMVAFEVPGTFTGELKITATSGQTVNSTSLSIGAETVPTTAKPAVPTSTPASVVPTTSLPSTPSPTTPATTPVVTKPSVGDYMIVTKAELAALPTSGTAFENMKRIADGSLGSVSLDDQDNQTAAKAVAAGLMFAKTGDAQYKAKVDPLLAQVAATKPTGASRALGWGRQIAGYAIAADLVGYRDPKFVQFMTDVRTMELPGHGRWTTIKGTAEDSASNWGAWALTSYLASSLYVGDTASVNSAITIYKGVIGDTAAYAKFNATDGYDPAWTCGAPAASAFHGPGINSSCSPKLDGAITEDIARSGGSFPAIDGTGLMYSWETLSGYVQTAWLIKHAGNADVYQWSDQALLRAGKFIAREGGWPAQYNVVYPTAVAINRIYSVNLGPLPGYGHGRQFGYTDWLTP